MFDTLAPDGFCCLYLESLAELEVVQWVRTAVCTYLYSDELEEPLTPTHLILGRRILKLPEFEEDEKDDRDF